MSSSGWTRPRAAGSRPPWTPSTARSRGSRAASSGCRSCGPGTALRPGADPCPAGRRRWSWTGRRGSCSSHGSLPAAGARRASGTAGHRLSCATRCATLICRPVDALQPRISRSQRPAVALRSFVRARLIACPRMPAHAIRDALVEGRYQPVLQSSRPTSTSCSSSADPHSAHERVPRWRRVTVRESRLYRPKGLTALPPRRETDMSRTPIGALAPARISYPS